MKGPYGPLSCGNAACSGFPAHEPIPTLQGALEALAAHVCTPIEEAPDGR